MSDLWPEDVGKPLPLRAPLSILREQASLLGPKTQNAVMAEVESLEMTSLGRSKDFKYGFFIVAPGLDNYTYRLFSVSFGIELYPVVFHIDDDLDRELGHASRDPDTVHVNPTIRADTEDALVDTLGRILNSQKTRKVVNALLSQVEDRF